MEEANNHTNDLNDPNNPNNPNNQSHKKAAMDTDTNAMNVTNSVDSNSDTKLEERVQELMRMVSGEHNDPPLGRHFSFDLHDQGQRCQFHNTTRFDVKGGLDEWLRLIGCGLTWSSLRKYTLKRGCIQIGSLYMSCSPLESYTFQHIIQVGEMASCFHISLLRNQEIQNGTEHHGNEHHGMNIMEMNIMELKRETKQTLLETQMH